MRHRYPRKWVRIYNNGDEADTLIVREPGGYYERYCGERFINKPGVLGCDESWAEEITTVHKWWKEVFDHHQEEMEIEAQFEKRCAIVYLKSVVRDIRKENEWFRQEHNSLKEKLARQEEQLRAMRAKLEGRKKALRHGKRKATPKTTTP